MFGIADKDLMDKNKIKIINGIAGSGKSTSTVSTLRRLNSNFILASFSNALKFAASDKFNCPTDTICGLEFVNTPFPRSEEKSVLEYDTVVNDEILLDGTQCISWMMNHVGETNIIALTDSRQMLNAENGSEVLKAFNKLLSQPYVISVDISDTKRARDEDTKNLYNELYKMNSDQLFTVNQVQSIFKCDVITIDEITFNTKDTYICHSNAIEHDLYKRYDLSNRYDINLIPKNHISRNRNVDVTKYPICDQITATEKKVQSYVQAANIATPTRFQGKEVDKSDNCYFIVEPESIFTGREIYTVATRCQSMSSLHIVIDNVTEYRDPLYISGKRVVKPIVLDVPNEDKIYECVKPSTMNRLIKKYGEKDQAYFDTMITSGNNIIYSTIPNKFFTLFADIDENQKATFKEKKVYHNRSIRSITKKDPTMHFDFMPRVYEILGHDVTPPRINNPVKCSKQDFTKLCDIFSAFPTMLNYSPMPKAGYIYEEYDPNLLNFYVYKGDKVTKDSLITEELANKLGDAEYVFSTAVQTGCKLGNYTYEQCKTSKEKKDKINKNFLWGMLESNYYDDMPVVINGETSIKYVKKPENTLELVACALWSRLCLVMLNAIDSIGVSEFVVVTDGLYYNGDKDPLLPEWCDYRIELKDWNDDTKSEEKYKNIIYKTYDDLKSDREVKNEKERNKEKSEEQKAHKLELQRKRRAEKKAKLEEARARK